MQARWIATLANGVLVQALYLVAWGTPTVAVALKSLSPLVRPYRPGMRSRASALQSCRWGLHSVCRASIRNPRWLSRPA
jgi:hypothetical protein